MTFEDAARLDADDVAGELDEGRWVPVTRNTWFHGEIVANVTTMLRLYARSHAGWSVSAGDPGARLRRDPDTLRGPDVGIVRSERKPTGHGEKGWLEGAPDLAVEILGDAQSASELVKKALEYFAAGGKMVWIIDPGPERVLVLTPPNQIRVVGRDEMLEGGDILPGFACKVTELFEP